MNKKILKLDEDVFDFGKVESFFEDKIDVLSVSANGVINFEIIDNYLKSLEERPNLYGLLAKPSNSNHWELKYIGQRKATSLRQRLRTHLVKCNHRTGSKINEVNELLENGFEIGIKLMAIIPNELRLYYEAKLLQSKKLKLDWNIHK